MELRPEQGFSLEQGQGDCALPNEKRARKPGVVADTFNPSNSGGGGREKDHGLRLIGKSMKPYLKNKRKAKGLGRGSHGRAPA
jgi:hypothetical protein